MRIWLAYTSHPEGAADPYTSLLPVGLLSINAVLREAGFDSRVANLSGMKLEDILAALRADSPSVVGFSHFTHNRFETLELARRVKDILPGCFIVLGGPHATFRWAEILESCMYIDAVVVGEGELTMLDLAGAIAHKRLPCTGIKGLAVRGADGTAILESSRQVISNLDSLPIAAKYLENQIGVNPREQLEFIITSRGCPSSCNFCSSPGFWGRQLRFRSPGSMIEEIRFLRDRFGLLYFSIRDDTFTADRKRVMDFCRTLIEERIFILWNCQSRVNALDSEMLGWMKRAGCECLQLGIESGSQKVLESLGKRITASQSETAARLVRSAGIRLSVYLIAGTLQEDVEDINATCRLVESMQPGDGQVSPLVYYPGSRMFEQGVLNGDVPSDLFERATSPSCPVRTDRSVANNTKKLLKSLESAALGAYFNSTDFKRQKSNLGFCHATNLMAGEYYADCGDSQSAENEYLEITRIEPDNPWGWLALGEFYGERGRIGEAIGSFKRLCELVPSHEPGYRALGELYALVGNTELSGKYLRLATTQYEEF